MPIRFIVQNVAADGVAVLNAADPIVVEMADTCPGSVTFFARDPHHPVMAAHRAQGKRVVFVEDNELVAVCGTFSHRIPLAEVTVTGGGVIGFQVENVMAAVSAAWAAGVDWASIFAGLKTFSSDRATVPGRFNLFHYRGATVIADYGHNPDAIQALVSAVEGMPATSRSVVISGAGDRRDDDIRQQTRILGTAFDRVVLYQDQCQRGRSDGEVLALLREGLTDATRAQEVTEIRGEFLAIDHALSLLKPGDLCLILIDQVEEALAHIEKRVSEIKQS